MLKSIDFMNRLEDDLKENIFQKNIIDYYLELRVNQKIEVYIASNSLKDADELFIKSITSDELSNKNISFTFLSEKKSQDDEYAHLFFGEKKSLGLRRSLGALLEVEENSNYKKNNVITFFSYKGGVGRTTSLALTTAYLSRRGKKVFVIDCDFEAPGLINFFNTSQADGCKNGLVEYLNDRNFLESIDISNYVYEVEKSYSGSGSINLMPAGNIIKSNADLVAYLEGMAKIDLQSKGLIKVLSQLIDEVNNKYKPDVILIDSRTGFNNTFGALAKLSNSLVVLAGDDIQNQPGIDYVTKSLNELNVNVCYVLSILSANFSRRYNNFSSFIRGATSPETEIFYFDRQNTLEFIGTPLEDKDDLDDFINGENGSAQYQKFFNYIYDILTSSKEFNEKSPEEEQVPLNNKSDISSIFDHSSLDCHELTIQDKVLEDIKDKLPNLYAENIEYSEEYIKNYFYFRPCMEDFLLTEKTILLGDKGTGKTAFYKALQNEGFFNLLISKSQKKHLGFSTINITNFEKDNFEFLGFEEIIKDELLIKRFWMFFIWNAICTKSHYQSENKNLLVTLDNFAAQDKILLIIKDSDKYSKIEQELENINERLKRSDKRLIINFDQLDNIVKPFLWNDVISPLVKIAIRFPYDFIHPKLFLRRDLYERLGNLTNKNAFSTRIINLEWSQNEIFSYFLKIVFSYSKNNFFKFLNISISNKELIKQVSKKLKTKDHEHNQLPLDKYLIQPVINAFFGDPKPKKNGAMSTAYEDLYRNIQSADKTVNLRPFIDLITSAIKMQEEQDEEKKYRKNAIIGLAYCTSSQVRKDAVVNYLEDLWNEKGNEFVKIFCLDIANNKVNISYKKNVLSGEAFDNLLDEIKNNNNDVEEIRNGTLEEFKQILIANKIITPYMVGSKTRYGFAYLYTNYLGI